MKSVQSCLSMSSMHIFWLLTCHNLGIQLSGLCCMKSVQSCLSMSSMHIFWLLTCHNLGIQLSGLCCMKSVQSCLSMSSMHIFWLLTCHNLGDPAKRLLPCEGCVHETFESDISGCISLHFVTGSVKLVHGAVSGNADIVLMLYTMACGCVLGKTKIWNWFFKI